MQDAITHDTLAQDWRRRMVTRSTLCALLLAIPVLAAAAIGVSAGPGSLPFGISSLVNGPSGSTVGVNGKPGINGVAPTASVPTVASTTAPGGAATGVGSSGGGSGGGAGGGGGSGGGSGGGHGGGSTGSTGGGGSSGSPTTGGSGSGSISVPNPAGGDPINVPNPGGNGGGGSSPIPTLPPLNVPGVGGVNSGASGTTLP
jgi:hypothetical protein